MQGFWIAIVWTSAALITRSPGWRTSSIQALQGNPRDGRGSSPGNVLLPARCRINWGHISLV